MRKYNEIGQEIIETTPMKSYCDFYDMDSVEYLVEHDMIECDCYSCNEAYKQILIEDDMLEQAQILIEDDMLEQEDKK